LGRCSIKGSSIFSLDPFHLSVNMILRSSR
jgi:hypothetical protein